MVISLFFRWQSSKIGVKLMAWWLVSDLSWLLLAMACLAVWMIQPDLAATGDVATQKEILNALL